GFDRSVRAEGQRGPARTQRLPGISAGEPVRPKASFGHDPVRSLVLGLHRSNGAVLSKARNIRRIDDLRMLDAPPPVALVGSGELLDGIENHLIGLVAN